MGLGKKRLSDALIVVLVVWMALAAFAAGFLFNDYLRSRTEAPPSRLLEDGDFVVFWEAMGWLEDSYIGDLPAGRQMTHGAIRGAIATLDDPYTVFVEPVIREHEREALRGNFGGIGATLQRNESGDIILTPMPGNPAEMAGILAGDILLAVDGTPITLEVTVEEIAQMIRGEKGTTVVLTVLQEGGAEPAEIAVVRDNILIPSVVYRLLPEDPTIGYIQLSRFSGESKGEVEEAIRTLQVKGAEALILDLRHNGGGLLDGAIGVADHFFRDGVLLYQQSRLEEERVFRASRQMAAGDMPLVVLIDSGTASAAEILAGALQDRGRAVLIGTSTFGKGSVQLVYDLSDGSSIHVTSARWYTPNRHLIDQQGLEPDIPVELTPEGQADGRDEMLERAVTYLQNGR